MRLRSWNMQMAGRRVALLQPALDIYYLRFWTDNAPNVSSPGALQSRPAFLAESTNVERQLGINYLTRLSLAESFYPSCISATIIHMLLSADYSDETAAENYGQILFPLAMSSF